MKILALDPAKNCGVAWQDTERPESFITATWHLGQAGDLGAQHNALEARLEGQITTLGVNLIAAENAGFGSINRATQAMHDERLGIIRKVAARHGIRLVLFHPTSIKSYATGTGKAKKPQMIAAAARLLGLRGLTDDEADAAWICHMAANPKHWPKPAAKKPRAKVFRSTKAAKKAGRLF